MKALSVLPPWWWFILHGYKDIENRSWPTAFRGTVYLHVGKTFHEEDILDDLWDIEKMPVAKLIEEMGTSLDEVDELPDRWRIVLQAARGCIVGKVDIVDCVTASSSPWFFGKYGFQLANPVVFDRPIPFRGMPGLFDVPDGIELAA